MSLLIYNLASGQQDLIKKDSAKVSLTKVYPIDSNSLLIDLQTIKFTKPLPFVLKKMLLLNPSSSYINKMQPWQNVKQEDINSIIAANRNSHLNALQQSIKPESAELRFIRTFLGVSQEVAAIILLIVHLAKY